MTNNEQPAVRKINNQLPTNNLKEYIGIIRTNILPIILIFVASIMVTLIYVTNAIDVYKTITTLKITKPQGSILTTSLMPEAESFSSDRFISNEIEILKSYNIREKVANALLDSFKVNPDISKYYYIVNKNPEVKAATISAPSLTRILGSITTIAQKRGLDIAEIEVQSPSNYEAKLIANEYAHVYLMYSVDFARRELTNMKNFLEEEKKKQGPIPWLEFVLGIIKFWWLPGFIIKFF